MKLSLAARITEEEGRHGAPNNLGIEPERSIFDVIIIEQPLLLCTDKIAAVNLRPAGNTGCHHQSGRSTLRLVNRQQWSRANERHASVQDAEKLRQFVEPCRTKKVPEP